jgi:hypothetical protein
MKSKSKEIFKPLKSLEIKGFIKDSLFDKVVANGDSLTVRIFIGTFILFFDYPNYGTNCGLIEMDIMALTCLWQTGTLRILVYISGILAQTPANFAIKIQ